MFLLQLASIAAVLGVSHAQGTGFYRADGRKVVDPDGEPFLAKGIALNGWLNLEAYAMRLDEVHSRHLNGHSNIERNVEDLLGSVEDANEFWKVFRENYVTGSDIELLKNLGFNSIRIPFNYRVISPEDQPGVYIEEGFEAMDRVIGWCRGQGLAVVLDMHATPGGQGRFPGKFAAIVAHVNPRSS